MEGAGDEVFRQRDGSAAGEDSIVADVVKDVEASRAEEAKKGPKDRPGTESWMKPMIFEPAADGGLVPEEVPPSMPCLLMANAVDFSRMTRFRQLLMTLVGRFDCLPISDRSSGASEASS